MLPLLYSIRRTLAVVVLLATGVTAASAQAVVSGHVTSGGEPVPFATVQLKGTSRGAAADLEGAYHLDVPADSVTLVASAVGYARAEQTVALTAGQTVVLNFDLAESALMGDEVVVSGTRTEQVRREVPVIVNVLDNRVFESTQSLSLSEALGFQPGVRLEVDCQTCNYSQVRLNGLGGSYSQILIDSRPIFSALNGLYGLDQIPTSMIDRVEVVRGGGSALFGASAVAGTINVITRAPEENTAAVSFQQGSTDGQAPDRALSMNTSLVNDDGSAGVFLFGLFRDRQPYDSDGDTFSEIAFMRNNSFGLRGFYQPAPGRKLTVEAHSLTEERQGGNHIGRAPHLADQGEYRLHNVLGGGVTYEQYLFGNTDKISVYASGQYTNRDHYTGIDHVDAYGDTENLTAVGGAQYSRTLGGLLGTPANTITVGAEGTLDDVQDQIPFYDRYLNQTTTQAGVYAQSDWKLNDRFTVLLGGRLDGHSNLDAPRFNPRANVLVNLTRDLQFRTSVATGFRAPQAFDADLHIAFAAGGVSLIEIDPDLVPETSRSLSSSLDFNQNNGGWQYGFTLEGFHTRLFDTFVLEEVEADAQGNQILERRNGGNSTVMGVTGEARYVWLENIEVQTGLTVQSSLYDDPVEWSAGLPGTRRFLKAPNVYGFAVVTGSPVRDLDLALSSLLTGPMDVPHVAGVIENDVLTRTPTFVELNLKAAYTLRPRNAPAVQVFGGVQNLLNQYQNDFDQGKFRDSNYVYGPARPRTPFLGMKLEL